MHPLGELAGIRSKPAVAARQIRYGDAQPFGKRDGRPSRRLLTGALAGGGDDVGGCLRTGLDVGGVAG